MCTILSNLFRINSIDINRNISTALNASNAAFSKSIKIRVLSQDVVWHSVFYVRNI